ncbi:glycosyltransferase family 2 protein [Bifidobacterium sp. UTCIF-39]|uniref:glycosyltransferase family 2 protein n=1 Tax=Bifidobacterium sp. UTCIF-39 TaxID=1465359 RepID=UPI00112C45F0|nr:glycosyltransferase family 2 protein [Bifidobacterium sp. UTCIF-39]
MDGMTAQKIENTSAKTTAADGRKNGKDRKVTDRLAIVVVTYKRQELLKTLFASFLASTIAPWRIVIVDNEHSDKTRAMVEEFSDKVTAQWGKTIADTDGNLNRVVYAPQTDNLGGSGGFSAGVKKAYELGAEWFWVMDDDVAIEPDGMAKLAKWMPTHDVIQGSRYDYDGGPFYWQYHFIVPLGIPNPIAPAAFGPAGYRVMNTMCFEGGLFRRNIVEQIGFPDPRFFIYWDDTIYGYLASKVTNPIIIPDRVMRRTREIGNWDIGGLRQLNSTSDMNRYHILRNRGYMARYFMAHGDYRGFLFGVGTIATIAKEIIRLVAVDRGHIGNGLKQIFRGWWDSHKLFHDPDWQPMPPLKTSAPASSTAPKR